MHNIEVLWTHRANLIYSMKKEKEKKYGTQQQLTASYLSSVLKGRAQVAVDLGSRVVK